MSSLLTSWPTWLVAFWEQWHVLIRVALILFGALLLRFIFAISIKRVIRGVVSQAKNRNGKQIVALSALDNARVVQRAQTMGSVLNNFTTWSLSIVAVTMVLAELGVQIGALAAGAGLLGAGIGFGAQALIRDLISGLFIVFEDQYGVGDSVNLGDVSGVVEAVGLRATQVRDESGVLWYVRNGEIAKVGNLSQGWSRATVDLVFSADADWQKAKSILEKAVAQVSPALAGKLTGNPEVWGIHALNGNQVVLRIVQQVKPTFADEVSRELRVVAKTALEKAKIKLAEPATIAFEKK